MLEPVLGRPPAATCGRVLSGSKDRWGTTKPVFTIAVAPDARVGCQRRNRKSDRSRVSDWPQQELQDELVAIRAVAKLGTKGMPDSGQLPARELEPQSLSGSVASSSYLMPRVRIF